MWIFQHLVFEWSFLLLVHITLMFYTYLATSQDVCALDDQMQVRSVASGRVINGFLGNDWVDG